ncbi:hypothetical protein ACI7RC_17225 [Brevibacillus sp. B_LB10_24]|jgi:uncharacterized membrane protein HdeD (DUF308 family)|uniref:hypothetical protein n=1 Tax=Brevibacillus TaxID=55080 RepID=UPI0002F9B7AF|nr:hypothetical protein [Brevibacillus massiliensis]
MADAKERRDVDTWALWTGWIGIVAGILAFLWSPFLFGAIGVILGIITLFSPAKTLAWWAIVLGVVGGIAHGFFY